MSAKVTTKTGDKGMTGVLGPERLPKEDPRIEALGAVDEATSALGLARAWCDDPVVAELLVRIQRDLYRLMAELATTTSRVNAIGMRITGEDVTWLERTQEELLARVALPQRSSCRAIHARAPRSTLPAPPCAAPSARFRGSSTRAP